MVLKEIFRPMHVLLSVLLDKSFPLTSNRVNVSRALFEIRPQDSAETIVEQTKFMTETYFRVGAEMDMSEIQPWRVFCKQTIQFKEIAMRMKSFQSLLKVVSVPKALKEASRASASQSNPFSQFRQESAHRIQPFKTTNACAMQASWEWVSYARAFAGSMKCTMKNQLHVSAGKGLEEWQMFVELVHKTQPQETARVFARWGSDGYRKLTFVISLVNLTLWERWLPWVAHKMYGFVSVWLDSYKMPKGSVQEYPILYVLQLQFSLLSLPLKIPFPVLGPASGTLSISDVSATLHHFSLSMVIAELAMQIKAGMEVHVPA
jgi:hypothetical protein